jgi:hypothetical protein
MSGTSEPFSGVNDKFGGSASCDELLLDMAMRPTGQNLPMSLQPAAGKRFVKKKDQTCENPTPPSSRHRGQGVSYFGCFFTHFLGTDRHHTTAEHTL